MNGATGDRSKRARACPVCNGHDEVQVFRRFLNDVVEVYVGGARSFAGTITAVDECTRLLQMEQLCGRPIVIRIDRIVAIEQHLADEVWALRDPEVAA